MKKASTATSKYRVVKMTQGSSYLNRQTWTGTMAAVYASRMPLTMVMAAEGEAAQGSCGCERQRKGLQQLVGARIGSHG